MGGGGLINFQKISKKNPKIWQKGGVLALLLKKINIGPFIKKNQKKETKKGVKKIYKKNHNFWPILTKLFQFFK